MTTSADQWAENLTVKVKRTMRRLQAGKQPTKDVPAWVLTGMEQADRIYYVMGEWKLTAKGKAENV